MAAESAGQIGLDLVVNQGEFKKQLAGIQGVAKKAGLTLAAAFSVKKLVDFGARCIELGSDLQEVQNVVDVTFPRMSKQVDTFAQGAAASFGLSETMAKKFTGTFGAMAKAFGFNERAAYEMSTALTGLAGDVASFYNISQDEAYTKLKSVFTGETESLKDLGVVMTQSALDSYALANGFGKTTKAMSEGEKVALRYKFVQDQLALASGDFIRTSDGWANQVRVLKLQFDSLKATIGQGLINVLTPVIKVINTIIGKLMSLANAFKSFTEMITGKGSSGGGAGAAASGMEAVAESADKASAAAGGAGNAAKKAAKDIKGATTGLDELNIISSPDAGGSGGGGVSGGYTADEFDMGELDTTAIEEMDAGYQGLIDKMKELSGLVKKGFWDGFGDVSVLGSIKKSLDGIKTSLKGIFTDPEVLSAAGKFADQTAYSLGQISGSAASIGLTIADNLLGGFSLFLEQNNSRIRGYLVSMFDIGGDIVRITGTAVEAFADIFEVFRSGPAKQITADIIQVFSDGFTGCTELAARFGRDVLDLITAPVIKNTGQIKDAFQGILEAVQSITLGISGLFRKTVDGILEVYDGKVHPLAMSLKDGISEIVSAVLEAFNIHILPVIQYAADQFTVFCTDTLQPLIEKFLEFAGKVSECVQAVWENALKPFVLWFIENISPVIADGLKRATDAFYDFWTRISQIIGYLLDALGGLIDFLTGVFTGDWKKAWTGIKTFFSSVWNAMKSLLITVLTAIVSFIGAKLSAVKNQWTLIWNAIRAFTDTLWNAIKNLAEAVFTAIQSKISAVWAVIRNTTETIWNGIRSFFTSTWTGIKDTVSSLADGIRDKIQMVMDAVKAGIQTALDSIREKWSSVWNGLKETTISVFDGMKDGIRGGINGILKGVETMANGVIKGLNRMIDALNNLSFDIPDWVPGLGGESFGLDIPTLREIQIPRLAKGGFVRANTPQLAMIGDNRHYGEIVAPEDRMQEMVKRAALMASQANSGMSDQYLALMVELLKQIIELIEAMDLTVNIDIREIKKKLTDLDKRTGFQLRTT